MSNAAYEIVARLEATPGKKDKEQIIFDAFMTGATQFFIGAQIAYDPLRSYGVKQVPLIEDDDLNPDDPGTFSFDDFLALVGRLERRDLTGNAARDALRDAATTCHGPTWNGFYRRAILKDLSCGVTESTINRVLEKLAATNPAATNMMVPRFEVMRAEDGEKDVHRKKIKGTKLVDVKLDGVRLITILNKEERSVRQFSREGHELTNFTAIRDALAPLLDVFPISMVLDGEVVSRSFQELMTQISRTKNVDTEQAKLALFDMLPLKDFLTGICKTHLISRHEMLSDLEISGVLKQAAGDRVFVVPKVLIDLDTPEGAASFAQFNRDALKAGFEGIMIKDPDSPYICKRRAFWLKKKPTISVTLTVVAVIRGEPDGKRRDVMGALLLRGEDDGRMIESECGTGFTDEQLAEIWNNQERYIGMMAEIEADALTKKRDSDTYSLRFPRFKGWRGRTPGEKL